MLKKFAGFMLCLVISFFVCPKSVCATGITEFIITSDKSEVRLGDTITYTISIDAVEKMQGFQFKIAIPDGLIYNEGSYHVTDGLKEIFGCEKAWFIEDKKGFCVYGGGCYTSTSAIQVMTFTCTATSKGNYTVKLVEIDMCDSELETIEWTPVEPSCTVKVGERSVFNPQNPDEEEKPPTGSDSFYFSESNGKYCIVGATGGTFSSLVSGGTIERIGDENITDVIANTVWTSSDPSVLEVTSASCIEEVGGARGNWWLQGETYKPGVVTITGTTNDGRMAVSKEISVEPELTIGDISCRITEETPVAVCHVILDEPNAAYLESFVSKVKVEITDNDLGAAYMNGQYYEVAEDGLSANIMINLEPIFDGEVKLKVTSSSGQIATGRINLDTDNLRPGVIGFLWAKEDRWGFSNSATADAFGVDQSEGYYITSNDYNRLISQLSNTEKNAITYSIHLADPTTHGVNVYRYNVDALSKHAHKSWGGSCYGMSVWACLRKKGILKAPDNNTPIFVLSDYSCTKQVESAINYYHMQQYLKTSLNAQEEFMNKTQTEQLGLLEQLCSKFNTSGMPVLICFEWYEKFKSNGECDTDSYAGHAVVGYGVEDIGPIQLDVQATSYTYNHRILIYDCAHPNNPNGSYNLYYNDEGIWCIPGWGIVSDNSQTSDTKYNNGRLALATADISVINAVDYTSGELSSLEKESSVKQSMTTIANNDYTLKWGNYCADISGFTVSNSNSTENINVVLAENITTNGEFIATTATAILPDSNRYTVESDEDNLAFQLNSGNYLTTVRANASGSIDFQADGSVMLNTNEPTEYDIDLTANEGYYTLPWYTIEITGSNATTVSAMLVEGGVLVSGDNLSDVTICGTNDEETKELDFTTDEKSVLITELNDEFTIAPVENHDSGDNGITPVDAAETGESPDFQFWIVMMLVSFTGLAGIVFIYKKCHE